MFKYSTLIAVLFLSTACGGGSGSSLVGATPPPTEQVVIQQMFETCGIDGLTVFRLVEEQPTALFEDGSPIPLSMFVTTVSTNEAYFVWQTNLDLDIPIDFEVRTEFQDANGDPMLPVPMAQFVTVLHGDLLDAWTMLASMPPGSRLVHTISTPKAQPGEPVIGATITHTVGVGGVLAASSGEYTADDGAGCMTVLSWSNVALATPAYQAAPLQGELNIILNVGVSDQLVGTLTWSGLPVAQLQVGLNGGFPYTYNYDLATDTISIP